MMRDRSDDDALATLHATATADLCFGPATKSPTSRPGFFISVLLPLLRWRDPRYIIFERLVCFFDEVGIERTNLGRLGDKALIGVLEVNLLRLLHRLGAEQLLKSLGA